MQQIAPSNSSLDNIKRFVEAGGPEGGVILSDKEEELYSRWEFADELLRRNYFNQGTRDSIARQLQWKFSISRSAAFRDIVNAEEVFSSSNPLNKRYLIHRRIEVLEIEVSKCYEKADVDAGAKLERELRGYIDMYPDFIVSPSAKTINYIINNNNNNLIVTSKTAEEAFNEADIVLKEMEEEDDEI